MRHRIHKKGFHRDSAQRKALIRGLVCSLVDHKRIKTTLAKAKELRRHVEKAVTLSRKGGVHVHRVLLSKYPHKPTVKSLVNEIGPQMKDRPGGYTRILKLGRRQGDQAPMAIIEFVNYKQEKPAELSRTEKKNQERKKILKKKEKRRSVREMKELSRKINR